MPSGFFGRKNPGDLGIGIRKNPTSKPPLVETVIFISIISGGANGRGAAEVFGVHGRGDELSAAKSKNRKIQIPAGKSIQQHQILH